MIGAESPGYNFNYTTNVGEERPPEDLAGLPFGMPFGSASFLNFPAAQLGAASQKQIDQYEKIVKEQHDYSTVTATPPSATPSVLGPAPSPISTEDIPSFIPPAYPQETTKSPVVIVQGPAGNQPQLIAGPVTNQTFAQPTQQVAGPSGALPVPQQPVPITAQPQPYVYNNVFNPPLPTPTQIDFYNTHQNPIPPAPQPPPGFNGVVASALKSPDMTTPDLEGFRTGLRGLFDRIFAALGSSADEVAKSRVLHAQKRMHQAQADIYRYPLDKKEATEELETAEAEYTQADASGDPDKIRAAQAKVEKAKAKVAKVEAKGESAPSRLEKAQEAFGRAQEDLERTSNPINKANAAFNVFKEGIGANSAGFKAGMGGISNAMQSISQGKGSEAIGDLLGGLAGALGGVAGAATGLIGAYFTIGQKLKDFGASIDNANLRFAEFSASMAEVKAKATIRDIEISQKRGERMAPYADKQVETQKDFEEAWSEYEDAAMAFFGDVKMLGQKAFMDIKSSTDSMLDYLMGIEGNTRPKQKDELPGTFKNIMEEQLKLEAERRRGRIPPRPMV